MKEISEIVNAYEIARKNGKRLALATLVHLNGSSYRRPGARMIVDETGQLTGAISGGCLEGDALRKAIFCIHQQLPKLVIYDTSDEDDATIGVQLGCSGIIQVLFEPIKEEDPHNPVELLKLAVQRRQNAVIVTLYSNQSKNGVHPGTTILQEESGYIINDTAYNIPSDLIKDIKETMELKKSAFKSYSNKDFPFNAFISYVAPPVSLIIVGAGNDAIPLQMIAETLGWQVTIVDGRHTYAKIERFSPSCQLVVSKPEKVLDQLIIDEKTVFVLMTHNYNYDYALLKALLGKKVTYIGTLGPKKKLDNMLLDLKKEGIFLNDEQKKSIYGPVGLEIGAETSAEIALSITAEILAAINHKKGGFLRNLTTEIHPRYFKD